MSTTDCYNFHRMVSQMFIDRQLDLIKQVCSFKEQNPSVEVKDVQEHFIYKELVKKCLKKPKKDDKAPKKPSSAYILFCNDERVSITKKHMGIKNTDVLKKLGEAWKSISPEIKTKYDALAQKDKERYTQEMSNYKEQPQVDSEYKQTTDITKSKLPSMSTNDCYNFHRMASQMLIDRELELVKQVCSFKDMNPNATTEEVQEHFIYKDLVKKCLKAKKDVNAPKNARSSYILFCNSIRKEVTEQFPNLKMHEISQKLSCQWNDAKEEVKEEFKILAEKDKERYKTEMDAYNKKLHEQNGSLSGVGSSNSSE